ncbi:MAG: D-glycero-beta-D-manno-heptose 1-phosphate adenylyltransferase, partial [Planctomycetes bacterium]|nr:D-glycero-beta-D-manno-heptose 1-phosphate adenylyltransferase [Planctomycetota bacterium]
EVGKVGVTPVERWEIEQALRETETDVLSKVRSVAELARIRERATATGRTAVFANGCFDILHVGHVVLLQKARSFGDMLIVGLNSDASIRRLKGPERPILRGEERALMLSALSWVDHIVFFDDDTPIDLIERLLPDVLVKGADYANKAVVGREIVEGRGGRVELVPLRPEISTSSIVDRIRQAEEGGELPSR